eukprot:scaffold27560_cov142-Isochrysis_galbana.AAC.1
MRRGGHGDEVRGAAPCRRTQPFGSGAQSRDSTYPVNARGVWPPSGVANHGLSLQSEAIPVRAMCYVCAIGCYSVRVAHGCGGPSGIAPSPGIVIVVCVCAVGADFCHAPCVASAVFSIFIL